MTSPITRKRRADDGCHDHDHVRPHRTGLSFDPVLVTAVVVAIVLLLAGFAACLRYASHVGTTNPDHHYQCVNNAGQPVDSSECSRPVPFIPAPVLVP